MLMKESVGFMSNSINGQNNFSNIGKDFLKGAAIGSAAYAGNRAIKAAIPAYKKAIQSQMSLLQSPDAASYIQNKQNVVDIIKSGKLYDNVSDGLKKYYKRVGGLMEQLKAGKKAGQEQFSMSKLQEQMSEFEPIKESAQNLTEQVNDICKNGGIEKFERQLQKEKNILAKGKTSKFYALEDAFSATTSKAKSKLSNAKNILETFIKSDSKKEFILNNKDKIKSSLKNVAKPALIGAAVITVLGIAARSLFNKKNKESEAQS